jgi:chromosomal replication initiation ATPase DnaA
MSFEQIGSFFGRHHTTVIEGVEKIEKMLKKDSDLQTYITNLYKKM